MLPRGKNNWIITLKSFLERLCNPISTPPKLGKKLELSNQYFLKFLDFMLNSHSINKVI